MYKLKIVKCFERKTVMLREAEEKNRKSSAQKATRVKEKTEVQECKTRPRNCCRTEVVKQHF